MPEATGRISTVKDKLPPRASTTLRLDAPNSMAKPLGSRRHEHALGLTLRDVRLPLLMHERPGLTVGERVKRSFVERTMVSKGITQPSQMGLVERNVVSTDARQMGLTLTERGQEAAEKARNIALDGIGGGCQLSQHEREIFEIALEKLTLKVRMDLDDIMRVEAEQRSGKRASR
jgi:DNA-binding MarR family transcriptional regulator